MRSRWTLIIVGLLTAVLALGAVACDDDDDDDDGDEPTATADAGDAGADATEPVDAGDGVEPDATEPVDSGDGADALELTLTEVGGSGITGTATISATNGDLEVVLAGEGLDPAASYVSAVYDSTSVTCMGGLLGGGFSPEFLGSDGGTTYSAAGTALEDVFSVSIRADGGATVVACGELAE